jgi:uncharacterized protein (UPF0332 family)
VRIAFDRATHSLEVAKSNLDNKFFPDSINRSYYAVFYAAQALLLKKGIVNKTHSGTIQQFGLNYVKNDKFSNEISKFLFLLEKDRNNADYDFSYESTEKKAQKDLNNAKIFIEECKKFL